MTDDERRIVLEGAVFVDPSTVGQLRRYLRDIAVPDETPLVVGVVIAPGPVVQVRPWLLDWTGTELVISVLPEGGE